MGRNKLFVGLVLSFFLHLPCIFLALQRWLLDRLHGNNFMIVLLSMILHSIPFLTHHLLKGILSFNQLDLKLLRSRPPLQENNLVPHDIVEMRTLRVTRRVQHRNGGNVVLGIGSLFALTHEMRRREIDGAESCCSVAAVVGCHSHTRGSSHVGARSALALGLAASQTLLK